MDSSQKLQFINGGIITNSLLNYPILSDSRFVNAGITSRLAVCAGWTFGDKQFSESRVEFLCTTIIESMQRRYHSNIPRNIDNDTDVMAIVNHLNPQGCSQLSSLNGQEISALFSACDWNIIRRVFENAIRDCVEE